MIGVPIQPVANQTLTVPLAGQNVQLVIQQKFYGLFMDVYVNNRLIVGGQICENLNRIVRDAYLGFIGDFVFLDTQGKSDPFYTGLNSRYILVYLDAVDLP
jgi:hypothetical protein